MSRSLAIEPTNQAKQQRVSDGATNDIQEKIRLRAFELYEARGHMDGHQEEDWYQAESELLKQHNINRAA